MTLNSMTGFGRAQAASSTAAWQWEVRSVNGRGLDVRLRLPPSTEHLEPRARELVGQRIQRGSVTVQAVVRRMASPVTVSINEDALAKVLFAAARLQAETGAAPPTVDGLLALKGVLELEEAETGEAEQGLDALMLATLGHALDDLAGARASEGARLAEIIAAQLDEIERLTGDVAASPSRTPQAIRQRLADQVARVLEANAAFDNDRLHQEALLLATRADVEEELKRLGSHVAAAREILAGTGPAGRKLDFLSQEFNREANTLCSKANATDIIRAGLALKVAIDQMREQVQNIE